LHRFAAPAKSVAGCPHHGAQFRMRARAGSSPMGR
jgi:hypothetical protein